MVSAAARAGVPVEFAIQFELNGYPNTTPTGCIWDVGANTLLAPDMRPKGTEVGQIFRSDQGAGGPNAMYAPVGPDRPRDARQLAPGGASSDLAPGPEPTFILDYLHRIFHDDAYLGI